MTTDSLKQKWDTCQDRAKRTPEAVAVSQQAEDARGVKHAPLAISLKASEAVNKNFGGQGAKPPGFPSLVTIGHNSTIPIAKIDTCPSAGWLVGECKHGTVRWVRLSCKRRDCPVCGEHRKHRISWRIRLGVEQLGGAAGAGWFVGTFDQDIEKKVAVRVVGKMVRWLRKETGIHFEYASTWEVTRAGRLHVNVIMAPWAYIPQSKLSTAWQRFGGGKRVWIERVGVAVANETAKAGRERIGNYVAKFDQMVLTGRGVTYSRGWPKLPDNPQAGRQGKITWRWVDDLELGCLREVAPGEYAFSYGEECHCFELGGSIPKNKFHGGIDKRCHAL